METPVYYLPAGASELAPLGSVSEEMFNTLAQVVSPMDATPQVFLFQKGKPPVELSIENLPFDLEEFDSDKLKVSLYYPAGAGTRGRVIKVLSVDEAKFGAARPGWRLYDKRYPSAAALAKAMDIHVQQITNAYKLVRDNEPEKRAMTIIGVKFMFEDDYVNAFCDESLRD